MDEKQERLLEQKLGYLADIAASHSLTNIYLFVIAVVLVGIAVTLVMG